MAVELGKQLNIRFQARFVGMIEREAMMHKENLCHIKSEQFFGAHAPVVPNLL